MQVLSLQEVKFSVNFNRQQKFDFLCVIVIFLDFEWFSVYYSVSKFNFLILTEWRSINELTQDESGLSCFFSVSVFLRNR